MADSMSIAPKTTKHWVGKLEYGVPCDAMGDGGGCSLCQELGMTNTPESDDMIERVALSIERSMFAPHELPLDAELHERYRVTARAAIEALREPTAT